MTKRIREIERLNQELLRFVNDDDVEALRSILVACKDVPLNTEKAIRNATKRGQNEMVVLLIEHINKIQKEKILLLAVENGHTDIVKLVINASVDIHTNKNSAIKTAAKKGYTSIVSILLDRGCDIGTAMYSAAINGREQTVKCILERGYIVTKDMDLFRWVARNGHTSIVGLFLDYGVDVNTNNDSALIWAVWKGHLSTTELLLDRGANVHAGNDEAIRTAAHEGYFEIVKLLIEKGANIHAKNEEALQRSAWRGYTKIVELLLDHGAVIHINDTVLTFASGEGHSNTVKLLLERGADVNINNSYSLRQAVRKGHIETVKVLLDFGADIHSDGDQSLLLAIKKRYSKIYELLIENGANINAIEKDLKQHIESRLRRKKLICTKWNGPSEIVFIKCREGHEFSSTPLVISVGVKCVECEKMRKMSEGERQALHTLQADGVEFIHDKAGFFSRKRLRADFQIQSLNLIIEIDGEQHFRNSINWNDDSFNRDRCKDEECKARGIHLARIPHVGKPEIIEGYVKSALKHVRGGGKLLGASLDYYDTPTLFLPATTI